HPAGAGSDVHERIRGGAHPPGGAGADGRAPGRDRPAGEGRVRESAMLTELAVLGGIMGLFVGLLEISHRLEETTPAQLTPEIALREAMRGPDGGALRIEFRRWGVESPPSRLPLDFGS